MSLQENATYCLRSWFQRILSFGHKKERTGFTTRRCTMSAKKNSVNYHQIIKKSMEHLFTTQVCLNNNLWNFCTIICDNTICIFAWIQSYNQHDLYHWVFYNYLVSVIRGNKGRYWYEFFYSQIMHPSDHN